MEKSRSNQIYEIWHQLLDDQKSKNKQVGNMASYSMDRYSKQENGIYLNGLNKDSKEAQQLQQLGFQLIYPTALSEQAVDRMDDIAKRQYETNMSKALVVDTKEQYHTLELANIIASHYYLNGYGIVGGYDIKNNTMTEYPKGEFEKDSEKGLNDILTKLGFETQIDEQLHVTVKSDIPYPSVKQSKFKQIYDKSKGKIKEVFSKLKSFINNKEQKQEKENSDDVHEL